MSIQNPPKEPTRLIKALHPPAPAHTVTAAGTTGGRLVRRVVSSVMLALAGIAALSVVYTRIADTAVINSDNASILLEADDVWHGNVLLHGWYLTALSFYTTDLPFYVAGIALRGNSQALMREVPAVIYALTVAASMALAGGGAIRERRRWGQITTFVLLGLPSLLVAQVVLVGVNHVATALFMVLTLLALERAETAKRPGALLTLFGFLLTGTIFGDSMAVVLLLLPIVLVSGARLLKDRGCWGTESWILLATMAAFLLSRVTMIGIRLAGGFVAGEPAMKLTYLETLPRNVVATVRGLLEMFRANFLGTDFGLETIGLFGGLLGLGFVLYAFRLGLMAWQRWEIGGDRLNEILTAAMAVNLLAYLLDYNVVYYLNTLYSPPERYLMPFFVFGAVLAGRLGVACVPDLCRFRVGLTALALVYGGFFAQQLSSPPVDLPAARLGRWLESRGLTYGYGSFWCANIVTAVNEGQVKVRPVSAESFPHLQRMYWFSKDRWYYETPAHFLVYDQSTYHGRKFLWKNVGLETAQHTFGKPDEIEQVGPYTVLIWKADITPALRVKAAR